MNRFFKITDKKLDKLENFQIPSTWWSRPYEYKFAADFLEKGDIIIDAGCGIEHPFKWFAVNFVKTVHAVDKDVRINEFPGQHGIVYWNIDLQDIVNHMQQVDKVFCLSVFEHLKVEEQQKIINTFYTVLKEKGTLVMTVDFPLLRPELLLKMFDKNKWSIGKCNYKESNDDVYYSPYGLKCYSLVAKKEKIKKK